MKEKIPNMIADEIEESATERSPEKAPQIDSQCVLQEEPQVDSLDSAFSLEGFFSRIESCYKTNKDERLFVDFSEYKEYESMATSITKSIALVNHSALIEFLSITIPKEAFGLERGEKILSPIEDASFTFSREDGIISYGIIIPFSGFCLSSYADSEAEVFGPNCDWLFEEGSYFSYEESNLEELKKKPEKSN